MDDLKQPQDNLRTLAARASASEALRPEAAAGGFVLAIGVAADR